MGEWSEHKEDSRVRWEKNSTYWDEYMGDESNEFHREIIKPHTQELLSVKPGERVLDIGCGNGNFSRRLAELGAEVVAFDYSSTMIERAKARSQTQRENISYHILDGTDYEALISLGKGSFHKAVANMALMDMAQIEPLFRALYHLLTDRGILVFSIMHPCFQPPGMKKIWEEEDVQGNMQKRTSIQIFRYSKPETWEGLGIRNQPEPSLYFHRPLSTLLRTCFELGFVANGIKEPVFNREKYQGKHWEWIDIPPVLIMRLLKL